MDPRNDKEYLWLTPEVIASIEEQLNPGHLAFHPPPTWACKRLEVALKDAYKKMFPQAASEPQYKGRAQEIAEEALNKILIMRLRELPTANKPIDQWIESKTADGPFSTLPITGALNVGLGHPTQPSSKKQTSRSPPVTTLPTLSSQSQYTPASSSTSISTGRGTSTINGNNSGSPLHQRATSSPGPSPSASNATNGSVRQRRGRGSGHRPGQPSGRGPHVCPFQGCGKSFQYPSKLKDHKHTHLTAKEFACTLGSCTKSFKRQRELKAHEKIIHPGHPPEPEAGHPSEAEVGDQDMPDAGEPEPVEDQMKTAGRRDESKTVDIEIDHKRKSPHIKQRRPPNKTPEAVEIRSSPPTLDGRGAATPGPESLSSPVPERHPSPVPERHSSLAPERDSSLAPERHSPPVPEQHSSPVLEQPPPSEPKQDPSQPPSRTSDPTLPAMPSIDEDRPSQKSKPKPRESKPKEITDTGAQIDRLAVGNLLAGF